MRHSRRVISSFVAAVLATSLLGPPAQAAPVRPGAACASPLDSTTVPVGKKKAKKVELVCWHNRSNPDTWAWATKGAGQVTPFTIPTSPTWRRIATPSPGGNPQFLPMAIDGIARLAAELDYYWIEVDVAAGKKVMAGVWAPKGASNRPVVVHFHGTGGLVFYEVELAANLAKNGYVVVMPLWFGPRAAFVEDIAPAARLPGLIQDPNGLPFTGANLELAQDMLPVLAAARQQPGVNAGSLHLSGQSRGGTIALVLGATTRGVASVVGLAPPFLPTQLNSPRYRGQVWEVLPRALVTKMTVPILIVAATLDELVPPSSTQDFLDAARTAGRTNVESVWVVGPHTAAYSLSPDTSVRVRQLVVAFLTRFG